MFKTSKIKNFQKAKRTFSLNFETTKFPSSTRSTKKKLCTIEILTYEIIYQLNKK